MGAELKLVSTRLIRKIGPEIMLRTKELKRLSVWRQNLKMKRERLKRLHARVEQMEAELEAEKRDWEAEADRLAEVPFGRIEEVIGIASDDDLRQEQG